MAKRKMGRPAKKGRWLYLVRTGDRQNRYMVQLQTDGEVKAALRKFYGDFTDTARRYCTAEEQTELARILADIAQLRETPNEDLPQLSSFNEELRWSWSFKWGDGATVVAVASVQRVRDTGPQDVEVQHGLL